MITKTEREFYERYFPKHVKKYPVSMQVSKEEQELILKLRKEQCRNCNWIKKREADDAH